MKAPAAQKVRLWDFQTGQQLLSADSGGFIQLSPYNRRVGVVSWARDAAWYFEVAQGA